jgi:hypothetical protein
MLILGCMDDPQVWCDTVLGADVKVQKMLRDILKTKVELII